MLKNLLKKQAAEYQKAQSGETTTFTVTPASAPKFWYLIIIGGLVFLGGFLGLGIFGWVMGGGAIAYGLLRDQRPKEHKQSSTFSVTPETITVGGRSFKKDEFHRLIIKNPWFDRAGLDVYTTNANAAAGMEHGMKLGELCYALDVEAGGKAHQLAGGMDRTTVFGLLSDVSKIVGLKVS
ncbi:MAG: hypothetical protein ABL957_04030 [Parvularculaceae bacterium]